MGKENDEMGQGKSFLGKERGFMCRGKGFIES